MIGKLTGHLVYAAQDHVLLEAGGIGYEIFCAPATLMALPGPGEVAALYTDMVVREDLMQLFGFASLEEREWHRLLTSVQGVGAKASIAILGALGAGGVQRALSVGDAAAFRAAPGVGPKLAARIANELAEKAPPVWAMAIEGAAGRASEGHPAPVAAPADAGGVAAADASEAPPPDRPRRGSKAAGAARPDHRTPDDRAAFADAVSALVNLGYDRMEAARAVQGAAADGASDGGAGEVPDLLRRALRSLAPNA